MKPGDAVTVPNDFGKPRYEGFISTPRSNQADGTSCVFTNWDGDGVYWDIPTHMLEAISVGQLSASMRKDCIKLRQKLYLRKT